ncbi:cytochrome c oxidase subunit II [Chthoniobacter sp.]|uniref:cytochrome c oxidase subunit II n=1 Tax=Chthoniobacter sp. TaxID=2510640 RepID=UPI0032AF69C6
MNYLSPTFHPASPEAGAISHLFVVTLVVCAIIFALVVGLIFYSLMRFRWQEGKSEPKQLAGNKTIEIVWTVIPLFIVAMLFAMTARTMGLSDPPPAPNPDLVMVGHQWWWEAKYPQSGVKTANEIHIPVGKAISVELQSADVLHEFWVPELARKMTTVPGHPNHIWLQADKAGTYLGVCSEFCGTQHAWMRFLVVAEDASSFDRWQRHQSAPSLPVVDGAAARGLAIFKQMTCASCHAIGGTGMEARIGPDLTHFASRKQIGAGAVENTPENLRRWLTNPQDVKPGVQMPNFKFRADQLSDLVAYFGTLK